MKKTAQIEQHCPNSVNKRYKIALKEANKSRHKYKMGAAIIKSGRVLSASANGEKTGRHAEIRAIFKDRESGRRQKKEPTVDFTGATMYIARQGGEELSRPCRACFLLIRSVGIKKIVFKEGKTIVSKVVAKENLKDYRNYFL
jgi:pyrimidine deaminase RibD-like protein